MPATSAFLAAAGLAAVVAMLTAGLFEYNFGDSEFLMLFLILVTLPFAAHARARSALRRSAARHDAAAPRRGRGARFVRASLRSACSSSATSCSIASSSAA